MKTRLLLILFLLSSTMLLATPPSEEGKLIFTYRCAGCHNVNKALTGPALAGVDQRHSLDWIINFVHSSQSVIKSGNPEAVALFEKFNRIPMPDHQDLSANDISNVLAFIRQSTVSTETSEPFRRPGKIRPAYLPLTGNEYGFFIGYVALVFLLVGGLVALVQVKMIQRKSKDQG
jgi:cytochrome c551/c552